LDVIRVTASPTSPRSAAKLRHSAITLSGGVRYQLHGKPGGRLCGCPAAGHRHGESHLGRRGAGWKTDYNNLLFNAGILGHLTDRQQLWFNFSQGFEIPDLAKYYGSGTYQLSNGHRLEQRDRTTQR
jgi:iron complex outermembrane receptor protein